MGEVLPQIIGAAQRQLCANIRAVAVTDHCLMAEQNRLEGTFTVVNVRALFCWVTASLLCSDCPELINDAMEQRVCRCVLLVGPRGSGKKMILNGALAKAFEGSTRQPPYLLAAVDGSSVTDNIQALDALAAQLSSQVVLS